MSQVRERAEDLPSAASVDGPEVTSKGLAETWRCIIAGRPDPIGTVLDAVTATDDMRHRFERHSAIARQAVMAGLFDGEKSARLGVRVTRELLEAAKAASGIASQTHLIEYALSKVALEDDFGRKLIARKGRIPEDIEF